MIINTFSTSDIALAAYIQTQGNNPVGVNRQNPKKVEFEFESSDFLDESVEDYFSGKALVEPKNFYFHLKNLKSWIMSDL